MYVVSFSRSCKNHSYVLCIFLLIPGPGLSNNRYVPPVAQGRVAILYRLLAMFHPRPFLMTRFGPQGTIACIRAQNKDYVDIVFRLVVSLVEEDLN